MDLLNMVDFDLLLSDANMPLYTGFELVTTIRKEKKFKNLGIAMLTGLRERKDVERALSAGVDDYIVKPLDPMLLVQKVNALFEKRPPQQHVEINLIGTTLSRASLMRPVTVETVSELGIRVVSEVNLKPGTVIDITAEFFREIQAQPPPMKVLTSETDLATGICRAQLIFLGAREDFLQNIRRWLYSHGASAKTAS
jgi:DNA-binding response OmpR family regulator